MKSSLILLATLLGFATQSAQAEKRFVYFSAGGAVTVYAIDRAGEYVYVAGQTAGKLAAYRLNDETGELSLIEEIETGKGPNWVKCVTIAD